MIISGWFNILITALLTSALIAVVVHYYGSGRKDSTKQAEEPKYRMLDDDDE